tara:strand:- start:3668 stop:4210 length:543 start_codon:yes stop_codon:yes gene_type:complete
MSRKGAGNVKYIDTKRVNSDIRRKLPPLPITDKYAANKRKYYEKNKAKVSARNKARYAANKEKYKAETIARRKAQYYKVFKIRYDGVCTVCGYSDYRALDFHHIDPSSKIDTIAQLCNRSVAWRRIKEELKKCELICANCHRIEHYGDHRRTADGPSFVERYEQEKAFKLKAQGRSSEEE